MHKPVAKQGTKFGGRSKRASVLSLTLCTAHASALVAGALAVGSAAQAQPVQSPPIFENVRIGPRFSPDPLVIRGISGGSVPVRSIAGRAETPTGPCVGFVDEQPDHTLVLTSFFNFLSLQVESPEDTTILIKGPGGSWCNDDLQGKNPGAAGQWLAGTYGIWIGSYEKNQYHPYVIRLSEVQLLNPGPFRR
jgi:hypothetical protein